MRFASEIRSSFVLESSIALTTKRLVITLNRHRIMTSWLGIATTQKRGPKWSTRIRTTRNTIVHCKNV